MNSRLSYCGLVDPRISASDKDLPVQTLHWPATSSKLSHASNDLWATAATRWWRWDRRGWRRKRKWIFIYVVVWHIRVFNVTAIKSDTGPVWHLFAYFVTFAWKSQQRWFWGKTHVFQESNCYSYWIPAKFRRASNPSPAFSTWTFNQPAGAKRSVLPTASVTPGQFFRDRSSYLYDLWLEQWYFVSKNVLTWNGKKLYLFQNFWDQYNNLFKRSICKQWRVRTSLLF